MKSQEKEQVQSPLPQAQAAEHHCRKFVDHVRIIIMIALALAPKPNKSWLWLCVYTFEI